MVYESDFYTTRRPYSSARPYVSSYSVTWRTIPHMPYPAHKRLVSIVHQPVRIYHAGAYQPIKIHSRVRPSIIAAELNRIRYLTRPSNKSYTEQYLSSKDYIDFDDETREIRAKTDNLLRRIHVFVPRPSISNYDETAPERLRSDDYVRRIINAKKSREDIESLPWYTTPEKRDIGAGHLACIKYAGGRPQSKRRSYYTVGDLVPGDVKTDVKLMSYYVKNRKAAEDASPSSVQHSERKEAHSAPAPSVTWADEVVHEEETAEETATPAAKQETTTAEVEQQLTEPEVQSKPEKKKKKEKKLVVQENNEIEDEEAEYDADGVKKQPDDDTIKKVQEYLEKKAAEKKMEEERRAWELAEARRIASELEIARLAKVEEEQRIRIAEIKEQERLEAERQAVVDRAEASRLEAERLVEDEKLYNEAVAQAIADEEERVTKEKHQEEIKKKQQDDEEKVVLESSTNGVGNELVVEEHHSEEHSIHADLSDQDNEAKPYEVDHDEDTQVEEDEHEEQDELENPFVDGEGAASSAQADEPVEDAPRVKVGGGGAGGEQGFDWSDYENEQEVGQAQAEEQTPEVEEEIRDATGDQEKVFDEAKVESQADVDEAQVEEEETQVTEETKVEEEEEEEATEETEETREEEAQAQEEETQVTEEEQAQVEEVQATEETEEAQVEEAKSEEKSDHDASEEEDEDEEEEEEE